MNHMPTLSARIGRDRLDALLQSWIDESPDSEIQAEIEDLLARHLLDLNEAGVVRPYDALRNRRMNLVHSWNEMCGTDPKGRERGAQEISRRLGHYMVFIHLAYLGFDLRKSPGDAEKRRDGLDAAIQKIDAGDAHWWQIGACEHDFVSGEEFDFEVRKWNLVIGRRGGRPDDLQPVEDVPPVALHQVEIDLPTGDVFLADWLSSGDMADGFTDLVDEGNPWRGGSQMENEKDAERYARDYGFVSVASSRRCLSVLTDGKSVTVGHHDEDGEHPLPPGYRYVRSLLVIDLRKVSVVDRSCLTALYSRIHDDARAKELVETISKDHDTVNFQLPPGRYRVLSSGRGYIEDLLDEGHPLRVPGYEPVMILEKV